MSIIVKTKDLGTISSVQEFMQAVWSHEPKEKTAIRMYRGQADNKWALVPKLFRMEGSIAYLKTIESRIDSLFRERCLYLMPFYPAKCYDMLSLCQHYGLPTRLLDWSSNPLMGLYFAVESLEPPRPIVWAYDGTQKQHLYGVAHNQEGPLNHSEDIVIIKPVTHSHRVVAQAGWHTVHPFGTPQDVKPMDQQPLALLRLAFMNVAPDKAGDIKKELRNMGIHAATVYGDLTSVCKELQDDLQIPMSARRCPFRHFATTEPPSGLLCAGKTGTDEDR
jgi:hypothetical protein